MHFLYGRTSSATTAPTHSAILTGNLVRHFAQFIHKMLANAIIGKSMQTEINAMTLPLDTRLGQHEDTHLLADGPKWKFNRGMLFWYELNSKQLYAFDALDDYCEMRIRECSSQLPSIHMLRMHVQEIKEVTYAFYGNCMRQPCGGDGIRQHD